LVKEVSILVKEFGTSQNELARIIGVKQSSINRMLTGRYDVHLSTLIALAEAINCEVVILRKKKEA